MLVKNDTTVGDDNVENETIGDDNIGNGTICTDNGGNESIGDDAENGMILYERCFIR